MGKTESPQILAAFAAAKEAQKAANLALYNLVNTHLPPGTGLSWRAANASVSSCCGQVVRFSRVDDKLWVINQHTGKQSRIFLRQILEITA